jgi:hypothetical protein
MHSQFIYDLESPERQEHLWCELPPVNRDGRIMSFETEKEAQAECDRLAGAL